MDDQQLKQLSAWMGFVGIMTIIGGVISAVMGLFAFVIGAIPGIIAIVLGVKLRNAKQYADAMLYEPAEMKHESSNLGMFFANLNAYFKIQGILIIISLVLAFVMVVLGLIIGISYYRYI